MSTVVRNYCFRACDPARKRAGFRGEAINERMVLTHHVAMEESMFVFFPAPPKVERPVAFGLEGPRCRLPKNIQ
jgi:hypothetical protein